jgi:hypothetical protein
MDSKNDKTVRSVPLGSDSQGFAIAGFVTGLLSLGMCLLPYVWVLLAVASIYLSEWGMFSTKRTLAIIGTVAAILAILLGLGNGIRIVIITLPEALQHLHSGY